MKKIQRIIVAVLLLILITGLAVWLTFRHPYATEYFTPEMQTKYSTVESVLASMKEGWRYDTDTHVRLMNEAYGFDVAKEYGTGKPSSESMEEGTSISYSKDKEMAYTSSQRSDKFFIRHNGRWVFYPETPWIMILELMHGMQ